MPISPTRRGAQPEYPRYPARHLAQTINYNLPGLNGANIKIDGPTLAAIYSGAVTQWDDPAIKAMNPGVALPHQTIIPVRRAEGSGDTFIFTQFLDFSADKSGEQSQAIGSTRSLGPMSPRKRPRPAMTASFRRSPPPPTRSATWASATPTQIAKAGLGTAMVENQNGKFLLPTPQSIADAAAQLDPRTPPYERISLVFAPGDNSYPLINYEYAVVSKSQPDAATADALRSFLRWSISETGGNAANYLQPVGFIPLPDFIRGTERGADKTDQSEVQHRLNEAAGAATGGRSDRPPFAERVHPGGYRGFRKVML